MSTQHGSNRRPIRQLPLARVFAPVAAAFLATLVGASPALAVTYPNVPLQSGSAFPAPNIMFILDDSGSMGRDYMPDAVPAVAPSDIRYAAYPRNGLSYNPANTYKPWIKYDGTRYNTGLVYTSAWDDTNYLTSATDLSSAITVYYVPKTPASNMAQSTSYWRWQNNKRQVTERGQWATAVDAAGATPSGFPKNSLSATTAQTGTFVYNYNFTLPALAAGQRYDTVTMSTNSGSSRTGAGADLYFRLGAAPTTGTYDCRSTSTTSNAESCSSTENFAGDTLYVSIRDGNASNAAFGGVTLSVAVTITNRCDISSSGTPDWVDCSPMLPNGARNQAQELTNYAIWYSYFRTRMKTAKAGASEAFSQIGSNVRVGFDTIWNNNALNIPVGADGGLFRNTATPTTNRSDWYARLVGASAGGTTPLKGALQRTGTYFKGTGTNGPWGPGTGASQVSCRQNFAILTTDGYWNADNGYGSPVGDADSTAVGTDNPVHTSADGNTTLGYTPINPFKDNVATARPDTLADVAMYYWKNDLRPTPNIPGGTGLENDVPASTVDPAFWQHMVTFGISIGEKGTLDPATALPSIVNGSVKWPNPLDAEDDERIDDLWHAAVNGHGSFVSANDPTEFAQALSDALSLIAARRGSASNVATNSTSFQSDTRVFQARYWTGRWTGELAAYSATAAGVAAEPSWQGSQGIPAYGSRNLRTWNGTAGTTFPTATQVTALDQSSRPLSPVNGTDNAAYIAGDPSKEERNDGLLRTREIPVRQSGVDVVKPTVLGDIIDSSPIYVPELQALFVGSNDGMLHGFNAVTGAEYFAYVPGGVDLTALKTLSDPDYTHSYLVDGPIAVSTTTQTPGHNYLVGTLGRGGKGVYGLDVKAPATFGNADVLWERTTGTNMGQVLGEPLIVTLNNSSTKAVIIGNGINSSSGNAVLMILNLATGAVIKEIDTGVGSDNALFAPRGWDNDGNGTVDFVYGGDLKGNLWKFDLSGNTVTSWVVANSGSPMYVARDASNNRQPITAGLSLAREPISGTRWVFFGTGRFLSTADVSDMSVQSMYGIIDSDATVTGRTSAGDGNIQKRQFFVAGTVGGKLVRGVEAAAVLPTGKEGWYLDMVAPPTPTAEGERIISNPRVFGTVLLTASLIPPLDNTCDAGGRGYINAINAFTGASLDEPFFNVNGSSSGGHPNFADDTITGGTTTVPISSVDLGIGMPTKPTMIDSLLVVGGSQDLGDIQGNPQGVGSRRISWREIRKD